MSRSTVEVTFPDGTVLYGLHNNTVDSLWRGLYATEDEAWGPMYDAYRVADWTTFGRLAFPEPVGEPEDVVITVDPGTDYAETFAGRATRNAVVEYERADA